LRGRRAFRGEGGMWVSKCVVVVFACLMTPALAGESPEFAAYVGQLPSYVSPHWKGDEPGAMRTSFYFTRCMDGDARAHLPHSLASWSVQDSGVAGGSSLPGTSISGWIRFHEGAVSSWDYTVSGENGTIHTCGPAPCQSRRASEGRFAGDVVSGELGTLIATSPGGWAIEPLNCPPEITRWGEL
jgi:hypothetical protein